MVDSLPGRKGVWQKQFPTLLGLVFLIVALGVGVFFFGAGGLGVFAPRATPQTTPKNIKITNVTDSTFTVSFLTDESTTGFVKYGTTESELKTQSSDDRDQLSGSVGDYSTHHVTVRSLQPNTIYYFTLGTGSGSDFNNDGVPFSVKTGPVSNETGTAQTIYGNVTTSDGRPADGAIVYVESPEMGEMSTLVKSSGSWAVALATARSADGLTLASLTETSSLQLMVQGSSSQEVSQLNVTVAEAQPIPTITLGSDSLNLTPTAAPTATTGTDLTGTEDATLSAVLPVLEETPADPGQLGGLLDDPVASGSGNVTVDLTNETPQTVTTSQPIISGLAAPNVLVNIEVHSENQISQQVVTDANGNFVLDTSLLAANLEPGEHTATYSYQDPTTGQTVTKTQTFYVASPTGSSNTLLAQATTGTQNQTGGPYSSGNPFPIPSPTPSPVASSSATPSASPVSTRSATTSSRPSTQSGVPVSGSTGTTIALLLGGVFFIFAGVWSYWVAMQVKGGENE